MAIECKHGQLARSCNICALEAELAEVTAQRDKLQELINAPEVEPALVVEVEPDYWSGGHYYEGSKPHINPLKVWKLPVGTKLYTAPPAPSVPDAELVTVPRELLGAASYAIKKNLPAPKILEQLRRYALGGVAAPTPAPSVPDEWRSAIAKEFPLYDEDGLDKDKHCCEWVMLQERKRLHKMLAEAVAAEREACAKICESVWDAWDAANEIRARGEKGQA